MLRLLPVAVFMTDRQGRIVRANAAAERLFGYSQDELIGALSDVVVSTMPTTPDSAQSVCINLGTPVRAMGRGPHRIVRRKDGTEFPAEVTSNPVSWDNESYTLTVVVDRTERYELQRNHQQLAHLTRVSTRGELAGSLAHELNQPLTAILSNARAAQRFMATQPINLAEVREILHDLVEDNAARARSSARSAHWSRRANSRPRPSRLRGGIEDVALLVHSDAIVRGIQVFLQIAPELPPVHADRVQLQQVVLNLLLNAFDTLESPSAHCRAVMVEALLDGKDSVRVAVRDSGQGIADDAFDKLFMPFFTSKREGLGLGLSISRSIVEMHEGHIWAENNQNRGATFYFTLLAVVTPAHTFARQQS